MRVTAVARAVTECFGHAHPDIHLAHAAAADDYRADPDGNAEHGTGPHASTQHASTQHASTQHIRHAHANRPHPEHDGHDGHDDHNG